MRMSGHGARAGTLLLRLAAAVPALMAQVSSYENSRNLLLHTVFRLYMQFSQEMLSWSAVPILCPPPTISAKV